MKAPATRVHGPTAGPDLKAFDDVLRSRGLEPLKRGTIEVLQINVGRRCNQTCIHCHVDAGPGRAEIMTRETMDRIVEWLARTTIPKVDLTGGSPEIVPDFRYLVQRLKSLSLPRHVMDRCNLTIFFEPDFETLPAFLAEQKVEVVASLPCYLQQNVDFQRGQGVFDKSIRALRLLNNLGYGSDPGLPMHLVFNPVEARLPAPQGDLESDYRRELGERYGIVFNRLYVITNLPIARFAAWLRQNGEYERYMRLLVEQFNPETVAGLMCRSMLSVGWRGEVYDCDFNQMLDMQWQDGKPLFLWDVDPARLEGRRIATGEHCFGCTAGAGSSCGGSLA